MPCKTTSYHVLVPYLPTVHEATDSGQPQKTRLALCGRHVLLQDMELPDWANTLQGGVGVRHPSRCLGPEINLTSSSSPLSRDLGLPGWRQTH